MNSIANYLQPSLVPFDTRWQPGCLLIFRDRSLELPDDVLLRQFSWTVDTEGKRSQLAGKTFYAERYGGSGIGVHGGGARCGFDGEKYQLKGIGPNPLLGVIGEDDIAQSDGELTLSSALYEMIWSQVLDSVMPFGTNRCLAILAVHEHNVFSRALLLRDGYLRPAHFERAAYFRGGVKGIRYEQASDVRRTAEMCLKLPAVLAATFNLRGDDQHCLVNGLSEFARRQGAQIACATSRFLYHSISSSNFSLDGRWHDFTSLSPLDPHNLSNINGIDSAWGVLWRQFSLVADVIASWIFHFAKYSHLSQSTAQALTRDVLTEFELALNNHYALNLLCMMGMPRVIAQVIYTETAVQAWAGSLLEILPSLPFWIQTMDERLPMTVLSFSNSASTFNHPGFFQQIQVAEWLSQREIVRCRAFAIAQEFGISAANLARAIDINSAKFLFSRQAVTWIAMTDYLDSIIANQDLTLADKIDILQSWCEEKIAYWRFHLTAEAGMQTTCWQDSRTGIVFDMQEGTFIVTSGKHLISVPPNKLYKYMTTCESGLAFSTYCEQAHLKL